MIMKINQQNPAQTNLTFQHPPCSKNFTSFFWGEDVEFWLVTL